jgi:hypothetical protein
MRRLIIAGVLVLFCEFVLALPSLRIVEDTPGYLSVEGNFLDILLEHKHSLAAVQYFFKQIEQKIGCEENTRKIFLSCNYQDEIHKSLQVKLNTVNFLPPEHEALLANYLPFAPFIKDLAPGEIKLCIPFDEFWQEAPSSVINSTDAALKIVQAFGTQFLPESTSILKVRADFLAFKRGIKERRSERELTWSESHAKLVDYWVPNPSFEVWEKLWAEIFTNFGLKLDPSLWPTQTPQEIKAEISAIPAFHWQEIASYESFADYRTIFLDKFLTSAANKDASENLTDAAKKLVPAYLSLLYKLGKIQGTLREYLRLRASVCGSLPSGDLQQAFAGGNTGQEVLEHLGWSLKSLWDIPDPQDFPSIIVSFINTQITYDEIARMVEIFYLSLAYSPQNINEMPTATDLQLDVPQLMEFLREKRVNPYLLPLLTTLERSKPN